MKIALYVFIMLCALCVAAATAGQRTASDRDAMRVPVHLVNPSPSEAPSPSVDFTWEEWLEREMTYRSPSEKECRDGYLDIFTGVTGKLISIGARPISMVTVGRLTGNPLAIELGAWGYRLLGAKIADSHFWLCWCLPYDFRISLDFYDENGTLELKVIEDYRAICCTRASLYVSNYSNDACDYPVPSIHECMRQAMFGNNLCY